MANHLNLHKICPMPILTLTTDYGLKDFYVSALKAKLYTQFPENTIVDISHLIPPFDLVQGSLIFKAAWSYFPQGTIHIVDIDHADGNPNLLVVEKSKHFFILPDNGLLSLIFYPDVPSSIFKLDYEKNSLEGINIYDLFAKGIRAIQQNMQGLSPTQQYMQSLSFQPTYTTDTIHTSVIYIDHYRNLILNLEKSLFEKLQRGRNFEIIIKRHSITKIHTSFNQVEENEICCLFSASGHLTIAINKSTAAELLGLSIGSELLIYFTN